MNKFAMRILVLGGLAGFSLAGAASAANTEGTARTLAVRYSESSLATDDGARVLYKRLAQAAERVCPSEPAFARLTTSSVLKCRQEALSAAVAKIHNQRLAALHASTGKAG
jgi:UrcA family protein